MVEMGEVWRQPGSVTGSAKGQGVRISWSKERACTACQGHSTLSPRSVDFRQKAHTPTVCSSFDRLRMSGLLDAPRTTRRTNDFGKALAWRGPPLTLPIGWVTYYTAAGGEGNGYVDTVRSESHRSNQGGVMTQPAARTVMQEIAPKLAELSADVLFGDVWERPELSKRDRSLITVATLTASVSHRPVAWTHRARAGQRRDPRGDLRGDRPHGFLRRLARRGQRRSRSQRGI